MKRLTLDETWTLCLKMWRWIAGRIEKGASWGKSISDLKIQWMNYHGYKEDEAMHDCFFCEYVWKRKNEKPYSDIRKSCALCPARRIDPNFHCDHANYSWDDHPLAFYAKLVELNKKRLSKKRKQ